MKKVWVLLKHTGFDSVYSDEYTTAYYVCWSYEDILYKIEKIKKANSQYPLKKISETNWILGPEDNEGFFGNSPIEFIAVEVNAEL